MSTGRSEEKLSRSEISETEETESSIAGDHQNINSKEFSSKNSEDVKNFLDKNSGQRNMEFKDKNDYQMSDSNVRKEKMKISDPELFKYYPNIPGK